MPPSLAVQTDWTASKLQSWQREEKAGFFLLRYLGWNGLARRIPTPLPLPPDPKAWAIQCEVCAARLIDLVATLGIELSFGGEAGYITKKRSEDLCQKLTAPLTSFMNSPSNLGLDYHFHSR